MLNEIWRYTTSILNFGTISWFTPRPSYSQEELVVPAELETVLVQNPS